jgi:hypothetical protein
MMHTFYTIETEAAFRRREWQRAADADARASQALASAAPKRRLHLPHLSLAALRSLATLRLPFSSALREPCSVLHAPCDTAM